MLTHLFRLIWNKKKHNFLLISEIFFSFIGLFAGFTFVLYPYNNYEIPTGFEHENIWVVNFDKPDEIKSVDSLQFFRESVKKVLLSIDGIEEVTFSSVNVPFSGNMANTEIRYNGKETWANFYTVEDNYEDLLGIKVLEGQWFSGDHMSKEKHMVINESLKEKLFGDSNALGEIVEFDVAGDGEFGFAPERMKVVGVVANTKDESEFEIPGAALFRQIDTSDMFDDYSILLKVTPGADAAFESRVYKTLTNTMKNAEIEIEHLTDMRAARNRALLVPYIIFIVIAGFLIINVALGIFGVLWYNIHKRRAEIGLRRAVGASGKAISRQLVAEAILLATLSLVLGSVFLVQFPLLNVFNLPANNYITALIYSIVFIYVLVIVCALYPGKQAADIYPAVALHED